MNGAAIAIDDAGIAAGENFDATWIAYVKNHEAFSGPRNEHELHRALDDHRLAIQCGGIAKDCPIVVFRRTSSEQANERQC